MKKFINDTYPALFYDQREDNLFIAEGVDIDKKWLGGAAIYGKQFNGKYWEQYATNIFTFGTNYQYIVNFKYLEKWNE